MELALLQLNAQIMEVQLVAIVLLGKIFSRYKSDNFKNVPAKLNEEYLLTYTLGKCLYYEMDDKVGELGNWHDI